jgi:hypothetical protein
MGVNWPNYRQVLDPWDDHDVAYRSQREAGKNSLPERSERYESPTTTTNDNEQLSVVIVVDCVGRWKFAEDLGEWSPFQAHAAAPASALFQHRNPCLPRDV